MRAVLDRHLADRLHGAAGRGRVEGLAQQPPPVLQAPPVQVRGDAPAVLAARVRSIFASQFAVLTTPRAGCGQPTLS